MQSLNLNEKKLFIFDWDGTLADSIELISSCLIDSFKELKFPDLSLEKAKSIIGLGLEDAFKVLTPGHSDHDRGQLLKVYKKFFLERSNQGISLFQGVDNTLLFLNERGAKTAVATGKSRVGLERDFSNTNVRQYIHSTRTVDECQPKPHPQMIDDIMHELGFSKEETIMVGDTTYDLEMAHNAGVDSLAITNGAHSLEKLQECRPLRFFDDFPALSRFIMNRE